MKVSPDHMTMPEDGAGHRTSTTTTTRPRWQADQARAQGVRNRWAARVPRVQDPL